MPSAITIATKNVDPRWELKLDTHAAMTVADVKDAIATEKSLVVDLVLDFAGKILEDDQTLAACGIRDGSALGVRPAMRVRCKDNVFFAKPRPRILSGDPEDACEDGET